MAQRAAAAETGPLPVARTVAELRRQVQSYRARGNRIGLVPTMGALHDGHRELVRRSGALCERTIASVFVNPRQFDRPDDLDRYPRTEAEDSAALAESGCDLLFAPGVEEIYPQGHATTVQVGGVTEPLEGEHRPGHFAAVATVVAKLLLQTLPDDVFFGEKDYQQLQTVRQLVRDLDIPVRIHGIETVREADGLALSSRNRQLDADQRRAAPEIYRVLCDCARQLRDGVQPADPVLEGGIRRLREAGFGKVDYLALADARDLTPLARAERPARLLVAAWLGQTRLIDNIPVG